MSEWDMSEAVANSKRSVKVVLILAVLVIAGVAIFCMW